MRAALLSAALLGACDDALDQRLAIVDEPRVLAVIADPAEARPNAMVTYSAVLAGPSGPLAIDPTWSYCTTPKAPTEDNSVSAGCVAGERLVMLGTGPTAMGTLPGDACAKFGPDVAMAGFRPRDPDPTGGFYQPVRVETAGAPLAFGLSRVTCNLASAGPTVALRYINEYVANENPIVDPLADDITTGRVPANSDVELRASWPAESAEQFLWFDADRQDLVVRRESIRVSWYATGGELPVDATLIAEDDDATSAPTMWRTPGPGDHSIWIVVRDSRGGVFARERAVTVE